MMNELTDEVLAARVQAGDAEAFGVLVERYGEKLRRYARKFLFDRDDAEDRVQEVFIKAYQNIQSYDSARRFSPWLYRIAHNEYVNALRARSRLAAFSVDVDTLFPHPHALEEADADAKHEDIRRELDRGLVSLPVKYREVLVLHYFEDMPYEEIADVLQIPVSTVGVRLMRGRVLLKKKIIHNDDRHDER